MTRPRLALALAALLAFCAAAAQAQGLYRWTDEKGRVHVTDSPPPASAKGVQKAGAAASTPAKPAATPSGAATPDSGTMPFELTLALKDFPVVLYTSPDCGAPCAQARAALNKRGVPFKETQVWDEASIEAMKRLGTTQVPTLTVGRSVQQGFEPGAFDALLDSARYPKAGTLKPRAQAAPPPPEGYAAQRQAETAQPAPAAEAPARPGLYSPKPGPGEPPVSRPYAPKPGTDEPKTGGPYAPKPPPTKPAAESAAQK
jgi:glutaredoxin